MAKARIEEVIRFFEKCLSDSGLGQAEVVLFGSQARGDATGGSDVDIAIISPAFRGKDAFERAGLTMDVEIRATRKFLLPFDIVTLTPEEFEGGSMIGDFIKAAGEGAP